MLQFDFENSVAYWIFATAHQLACTINEELAALGITHRQWEVLAWISYSGEMSQTELAEKMGIEAPTLVGVLDRMERDGWIARVPSEVDRRKKMIRATEKVEPVWAQMVACGMGIRARATRGLTSEQLQEMRNTLEIMRKNLAKPVSTDKLDSATSVGSALTGDVPA
ncbi:MAG: MarR family winged helix-turn-helix transcriptional regulator [Pirellulales bacterium]